MNIEKLINIGFTKLGKWNLINKDELDLTLNEKNNLRTQTAIYAFVCNDKVMYVGKTTNTLKKRFNGYLKPGKSQNTNIGINSVIKETIKNGEEILIYIFEDKSLLKYGEFDINLAEGLEKSIIDKLKPKWNGKGLLNKTELLEKKGENVYWGKEDWEWDSFYSCHHKILNGADINKTLVEFNISPIRFIQLQTKLPQNIHILPEKIESAVFSTYQTDDLKVLYETIISQAISGETERFGLEIKKELERRYTNA